MKKTIVYLYKTTCLINNKIYIGIHKTNNIDGYIGSGVALKNAIKKYGKINFKNEILEYFDNYDSARKREKEIVNDEFVLREDTYNISIGGTGGKTTQAPWNKGKKGLQNHTEEWKIANSLRLKQRHNENGNPMKGKKPWNKGLRQPSEQRAKHSKVMKGRLMGQKNGMYINVDEDTKFSIIDLYFDKYKNLKNIEKEMNISKYKIISILKEKFNIHYNKKIKRWEISG